ncbi:MAG: RidA family protein [Oscillospiraceae bacterium]
MKKEISTPNAPAAIGPYSQGVCVGGFVYTSGQLPIDVATGTMPATIEEQARNSLSNIRTILEAAGSGMDKVIKTTVFLKDMNDFTAMNGVYETFFTPGKYPARSAVQVARLPKDALLEIEAIAEA